LLIALTATCPAGDIFRWHEEFDVALRGQSPDAPAISPPMTSPPPGSYDPFNSSPGGIPSSSFSTTPMDPFMSGPEFYQPGPPPPMVPLSGPTGPQPYHMGFLSKFDFAYLPSAHTSPNVGNFSAAELDTEYVFTGALDIGLIYSLAGQFDYQNWRATNSFNHDLYRYGMNLQVGTPAGSGPFGFQAAFNPSLNTDWYSSLSASAVNYDANAMVFYQMDPIWLFVVGVGYLDRVDDIFLPYAGVVITPNDLWEFRLLYPQGRISRYLGEFWWGVHWLYLAWEYHVDSFQVDIPNNSQGQIQMEDYRLTLGMRSDHPGFTKYIEAGWVFGRNVEYRNTLPGFDISDGFIVRGGIRF
jgi:hypothetical protein